VTDMRQEGHERDEEVPLASELRTNADIHA
jgi:hypothetical protein